MYAHPCPPPYEHVQLTGGAWKKVSDIPALKERLQGEDNREEEKIEAFALPPDDDEKETAAKAAYLAAIKRDTVKEAEKDNGEKKRGRCKESDVGRTEKVKQLKKGSEKENKSKSHNWIYISGLPSDVSEDEVLRHFTKVGVLAINPVTQEPKFKLYRDERGRPKGDASLCYLRSESVDMALHVLHEGCLRPGCPLEVTRADFGSTSSSSSVGPTADSDTTAKGSRQRSLVAPGQLKVMQAAHKQSLTWNDDDDGGGVHKRDQLTIVVLHHAFDQRYSTSLPSEEERCAYFSSVERRVVALCEPYGAIAKITLFSKHPDGVVIVKFHTNHAAQQLVKNLRRGGNGTMTASYWDGTTDYSVEPGLLADHSEEKQSEQVNDGGEESEDEYSRWLEADDDLPEDLKVRTE